MFKSVPKILAHVSSVESHNFVTPEYILNKGDSGVNLFNRYCPHRMYRMYEAGAHTDEIVCDFHNFKWQKDGTPINHPRKINCGTAEIGRSGLVFKDFVEPDHFWVSDLAKERNLSYSHSTHGSSKGSWLWMMEIQADLLHIHNQPGAVHPELAAVTDLDKIDMYQGDGWILQTCTTGWWLFVYPYTFVEWSPGCLSVNYTIPNNVNSEFGFDWITQFYYDPTTTAEKKLEFESLEDVFHQDVAAIERQKGNYFPLMRAVNRLEDHCVHFGKWVQKNRL